MVIKTKKSKKSYSTPGFNSWSNSSEKKEHLIALKRDADSQATPYDKEKNHNVGDYIKHSTFGFGFIQRVIDRTKVAVFFENSEKILLQNWPKSL